ncbi:hypothetical protein CRUP_034283, partial [Coryphaenoides rupestris]
MVTTISQVIEATSARTDDEEEKESICTEQSVGEEEEEEEEMEEEVMEEERTAEELGGRGGESEGNEDKDEDGRSRGQMASAVVSDAKPPRPDPAFNRRCSLLASEVEYKRDFEKMKGQSQFVPGVEVAHSRSISAVISE